MDITTGIIVDFMSISQRLAYRILVGLPPVHGLYTSLIGLSKHVSPGAFSIIALMVGSFVKGILNKQILFQNEEVEFEIKMVCGVIFFTGIIQIIFAVYLSNSLIKDLTSKVVIRAVASEVESF